MTPKALDLLATMRGRIDFKLCTMIHGSRDGTSAIRPMIEIKCNAPPSRNDDREYCLTHQFLPEDEPYIARIIERLVVALHKQVWGKEPG
jgi:hypothetical protein